VIWQRAGPNVTVSRLRHLLARADVTLARRHRPRLQRIPEIIAAVEQYHVAKHYAASSSIMRTWWTQQRAVRLKGDNIKHTLCVRYYYTTIAPRSPPLTLSLSLALTLVTPFSAQTRKGRNSMRDLVVRPENVRSLCTRAYCSSAKNQLEQSNLI